MMANSFVIDQVSWHTSVPGNPETRDQIVHRFYIAANFLQSNGLTLRNLIREEASIDEHFRINSNDLTQEGLAVMKLAYDKWLTKVDGGMPPEDVSLLEMALNRVSGA